jgi:hypothetical protein
VCKADNLTILYHCHEIWELTSWNPLGHSRPVTGLLYHFYDCDKVQLREHSFNPLGLELKCLVGAKGATNLNEGCLKGKAIPLQAWTGPEGSRRLKLLDFKTVGT